MEMRKIFDTKGVWLVNLAKFTFVDPESGCRFDPNIPTQAPETAWVKAQEAVIKPWVDPTEANEAAEKAEAQRLVNEAEAQKLANEAAQAEAERVAAEKAAAEAAKKTK